MADYGQHQQLHIRARRRRQRWHDSLMAMMEPVESNSASVEIDVGRRLRELRAEHSLSIRTLAEMSGLNFNTLSLIENNRSSPSVSTLQQLARALGVPIAVFFESVQAPRQVVFQKSGQRPHATFAYGLLEDMGAGLTLQGGQPLLVTMNPGMDSGPSPIVHTGHEFVFCLEGNLSYQVAGEDYLMEAGDSLLFEAHLPHCWKNPGEDISRSLLILCPADENDISTEQHFIQEEDLENANPSRSEEQ